MEKQRGGIILVEANFSKKITSKMPMVASP